MGVGAESRSLRRRVKQAVAGWIYKAKIMRVGRSELVKSFGVARRCKREQKRGRWHSPKKPTTPSNKN